MAYKLEVFHKAQKEVSTFPRSIQVKVSEAIDRLKEDPRPAGYRKLIGTELFRVRVGRYRIVYAIDDTARLVIVLKVTHRNEDNYNRL